LSSAPRRVPFEVAILGRVCAEVRLTKRITGEQTTRLSTVFGKRFEGALQALKEGRVKRYVFKPSKRVIWVVVGKEQDYQIIPSVDFCTCPDFYFRVLDQEIHLCYHLIAQKLAEASGRYESIEESDEFYETLMEEWRRPSKKIP